MAQGPTVRAKRIMIRGPRNGSRYGRREIGNILIDRLPEGKGGDPRACSSET